MPKFIGRNIKVGIGKETTRGTAVAPAAWLELSKSDFDDKFDHVVDNAGIGVIEDAKGLRVSRRYSEGSLSGKITDKAIGYFLLAALGNVSTASKAGDAAVKEHTFTVKQDAQHPTLTVEAKNPNEQLAFAKAALSELEIKAEAGKFVEFSAKMMANAGASASNTPSYQSETAFLSKDMSAKLADSLAGLDAASNISVRSVSLKVEKNIISDDVIGSDQPADFPNTELVLTGSIELNYDATTYKTMALAGSQKALRITLEDVSTTIGTASHPKLVINLAKVQLTEWAKEGDLGDIVKQILTFKAFYSLPDAKSVDAILSNLQANY